MRFRPARLSSSCRPVPAISDREKFHYLEPSDLSRSAVATSPYLAAGEAETTDKGMREGAPWALWKAEAMGAK